MKTKPKRDRAPKPAAERPQGRRVRRGRPPGGGKHRILLPGLRDRREDADLSCEDAAAALAATSIDGAPGPIVTGSGWRNWEGGGTVPVAYVPFLAAALRCTESQLRLGAIGGKRP